MSAHRGDAEPFGLRFELEPGGTRTATAVAADAARPALRERQSPLLPAPATVSRSSTAVYIEVMGSATTTYGEAGTEAQCRHTQMSAHKNNDRTVT